MGEGGERPPFSLRRDASATTERTVKGRGPVGCWTCQPLAAVSRGRLESDNHACCHTEVNVSDHAGYLTQSWYTDTWPTSPTADPITPKTWRGRH